MVFKKVRDNYWVDESGNYAIQVAANARKYIILAKLKKPWVILTEYTIFGTGDIRHKNLNKLKLELNRRLTHFQPFEPTAETFTGVTYWDKFINLLPGRRKEAGKGGYSFTKKAYSLETYFQFLTRKEMKELVEFIDKDSSLYKKICKELKMK